VAGLKVKPAVACYTELAQPAPLPLNVYDGDQTITIPFDAIPFDDYTLQLNDRVLINVTAPFENKAKNGVYIVTQLTPTMAFVRATDLDGSPLRRI